MAQMIVLFFGLSQKVHFDIVVTLGTISRVVVATVKFLLRISKSKIDNIKMHFDTLPFFVQNSELPHLLLPLFQNADDILLH